MTGDEDDGNVDARVHQLTLELEAVDSGKSHIEDKAAGSVRALAAQEFLRRREGLGTQAYRLHHALDGRTHQGIVIDDEHRGRSCGLHREPRLGCIGAIYHKVHRHLLQLEESLSTSLELT